jgi:AcrR family transcriptional regulator
MQSTRRAEHVADTRQALLTAARALFTERGYAATGTEEIVARARVTRGALYHHFRDKTALFKAVMEQVALEVAETLVDSELARAGQQDADAWTQIREGFDAFLDLCVRTDEFQRIVLVEGPAVLGHDAWDALVEQHGYSLLAAWLEKAVEDRRITAVPVMALTRMLAAVLSEAGLYIARAPDPAVARQEIGAGLAALLSGLERRTDA